MRIKKGILFILLILILSASILIMLGGGFGNRSNAELFGENERTYIAHRGLHNYFAENSLEAYTKCESLNFKAIEADIRVTKDNELIVFHDYNTSRLLDTNSTIDKFTKNELNRFVIFFHGKATDNKILSVDELLEYFGNTFKIYLDNKVNKKWVADSLIAKIDKNKSSGSVVIASSNLLFLAYIKYKNKNILTALEGFNSGKEWFYKFIPKNFKPDYYSSFISEVDESHISFLKANNILKNKIVYGVDSSNFELVHKFGLQNIIIDFDSSLSDIIKFQQ